MPAPARPFHSYVTFGLEGMGRHYASRIHEFDASARLASIVDWMGGLDPIFFYSSIQSSSGPFEGRCPLDMVMDDTF